MRVALKTSRRRGCRRVRSSGPFRPRYPRIEVVPGRRSRVLLRRTCGVSFGTVPAWQSPVIALRRRRSAAAPVLVWARPCLLPHRKSPSTRGFWALRLPSTDGASSQHLRHPRSEASKHPREFCPALHQARVDHLLETKGTLQRRLRGSPNGLGLGLGAQAVGAEGVDTDERAWPASAPECSRRIERQFEQGGRSSGSSGFGEPTNPRIRASGESQQCGSDGGCCPLLKHWRRQSSGFVFDPHARLRTRRQALLIPGSGQPAERPALPQGASPARVRARRWQNALPADGRTYGAGSPEFRASHGHRLSFGTPRASGSTRIPHIQLGARFAG